MDLTFTMKELFLFKDTMLWMIAPKAPGHTSEIKLQVEEIPDLIAVHQDAHVEYSKQVTLSLCNSAY